MDHRLAATHGRTRAGRAPALSPRGEDAERRGDRRVDVALVCSPGGHLQQLLALRDAWAPYRTVWVTLRSSDCVSLLAEEEVVYAWGPTSRHPLNAVRNTWLAWRTLAARRPRIVLTTGAALAVPFCLVGRAMGARVVYVESLTRIGSPSLSCRMLRRVVHRVYAQWPELAELHPWMRYAGPLFEGR